MGFTSAYVCAAYVIVLLACVVGAFDRDYDANLLQRLALFIFAMWSAWRIQLVSANGWGYPHEPLVASALLMYAAGSVYKTLKWTLRHKSVRDSNPRRRRGDL